MFRFPRALPAVLAFVIASTGFVRDVQATMISTEQVAAAEGGRSGEAARAHLLSLLDRAEVAAGLQARGVRVDEARARVAALTDAEAAIVADTMDKAPAGSSDLIGVLVFLFVLLLITDILGFTKVFPFTRSVR
jgi:hypothetical protein